MNGKIQYKWPFSIANNYVTLPESKHNCHNCHNCHNHLAASMFFLGPGSGVLRRPWPPRGLEISPRPPAISDSVLSSIPGEHREHSKIGRARGGSPRQSVVSTEEKNILLWLYQKHILYIYIYIYIMIYHHLSLYIIIYHYISLYIIKYHYISLHIITYHYKSISILYIYIYIIYIYMCIYSSNHPKL